MHHALIVLAVMVALPLTIQTNAARIDKNLAEDEIVADNIKDFKKIDRNEKQVMPNAPHDKPMLEISDEVKQWLMKEEQALEGIVKNAPAKVEELVPEALSSIKNWGSAIGETISDTFHKIVDWI